MTYNVGTATDYIDLLDQLIEVLTSRHMDTVAINAGGTGHAVGDIIDIDATGSTSTHVAQIEVTSESGGVIDGARIYRGGAYTVDPTTTTGNAQSATTGSGTGATFDLTFAPTGWTQLARESEAVSATVSVAGNGYNVNDTLTLVGGVLAEGGSAATFNVDTLTGGAGTGVATVSLVSAGDYEVFPADSVLTTNDGSGDNACTLDVTWQDVSGDTVIVLQGEAGSSTDPLVGIKTYSSETDETGGDTVYNWALFGMTAWSSNFGLHDQANCSPGFNTGAGDGTLTSSVSGDGAFVPLKDSTGADIEWWIRATGRSVVISAKVIGSSTTYYPEFGFGLLNQLGTTSEVPYPAFVAGVSDRKRVYYEDVLSVFGGLSEVISRNNGPMFVWAPEGAWLEAKNASITANQSTLVSVSTGNVAPRVQVWPVGECNARTDDDQIWAAASAAGFDNDDLTLSASPTRIYRTPDTGGDLWPLFPVTVVQADSSTGFFRSFGEIDGVFWFDAADGGVSSEDRFTQGGDAYTAFQNGTRIADWSYLAFKED